MARKNGMARGKKPFPGMGKFVVITLDYPRENLWSAYAGAASEDAARKRAREMSHHPNVRIVENVPGAEMPGIIAGYND